MPNAATPSPSTRGLADVLLCMSRVGGVAFEMRTFETQGGAQRREVQQMGEVA